MSQFVHITASCLNTRGLSQVSGEDALDFQKIPRFLDIPSPPPLLHFWRVHAYGFHREFVFVRDWVILSRIFNFSRPVTLAFPLVFSYSHGQIDRFSQTDSSGRCHARYGGFILGQIHGTWVTDGEIRPLGAWPRTASTHHMSGVLPQASAFNLQSVSSITSLLPAATPPSSPSFPLRT